MQGGCFTAKGNNRHTVIALLRILLIYFVNEVVNCRLHGILAGVRIFFRCLSIKIICHRTRLIQHQHNIQGLRADSLSHLVGEICLQRQHIARFIDRFFDLHRAICIR